MPLERPDPLLVAIDGGIELAGSEIGLYPGQHGAAEDPECGVIGEKGWVMELDPGCQPVDHEAGHFLGFIDDGRAISIQELHLEAGCKRTGVHGSQQGCVYGCGSLEHQVTRMIPGKVWQIGRVHLARS